MPARNIMICAAVCLLFVLMLSSTAGANLIKNPSFENGYYPWGTNNSFVANDWTPFVLQGSPQYLRSSFECINGVTSQQVWTDGVPFLAGIYQQVNGVTPGHSYRMTAWTLTIWNGTGSPRVDGRMKRKIGIDPFGGTDPNSANIIWSPENSIDKQWKELTVTATAQSSTITVFFWLDDRDCGSQDQFFCDAVILTSIAVGVAMSNVQAVDITPSSARITWTTNVPSTSQVDYGVSADYGMGVYDGILTTSHSVTLTGLDAATTYHYRATSTADGYNPGVSADQTFATLRPPSIPISQVKAQPDGTVVTLTHKTVTAGTNQLSGTFYIQDEDCSSGIRVFVGANGPTVTAGSGVDVSGTLSTSSGERQIINPTVTLYPPSYSVPSPCTMLSSQVGGGSLNQHTPGVFGGIGVHNTGLLIQVWGRVTHVDTLAKLFYVDDGCGLRDGSGHRGLLVHFGGLAPGNVIELPNEGGIVKVTGISARRSVAGNIVPAVRPRTQADVVLIVP